MMTWLHWQRIADFIALSAAVYFVLRWARGARALRVVLLVLGMQAASRVLRHLDLTITSWILDISTVLVVLMLVFSFQSEFRHAFLKLDTLLRRGIWPAKALGGVCPAIAEAAFALAGQRLGALIVLARKDRLEELVSGGVPVGAQVTPEILIAIFQKPSPVHDGAALVQDGRIARAGAVLPLTQRAAVPPAFGTRHRAAMGLAERSDALIVAVSEERGQVTLVHDLEILPMPGDGHLAAALQNLAGQAPVQWRKRFRGWLFSGLRLKAAAIVLAGLLWSLASGGPGATVRIMSVPVEFSGVPPGTEIANQSATRLEVQLRGASWLMRSVGLSGLLARFDLSGAGKGSTTLKIRPEDLNLPPGVVVEQVRPEWITVRLVDRRSPPAASDQLH